MPRTLGAFGPGRGPEAIRAMPRGLPVALPQELQKPKQTRQRFTEEDDQLIVAEVGNNRFPNWSEIAAKIPGKTGRQCRERYQHYLSPNLSQDPWTPEEDDLIRKLYNEYGPNWAKIAESFDGKRSNNNIKNRWNNHLRHSDRKLVLPLLPVFNSSSPIQPAVQSPVPVPLVKPYPTSPQAPLPPMNPTNTSTFATDEEGGLMEIDEFFLDSDTEQQESGGMTDWTVDDIWGESVGFDTDFC